MYVDDTCVILSSANKEEFFQHINSIDPRIQFTSEESKPDGSIPFLDCLVVPQADGSIITTVYRKPTHTDMYMNWDSYHHLAAKYIVINTLRHRTKTVYHQTVIGKRRKPSLQRPKKMQIPFMGLEQNKHPKETEEKQPRDQQHQEVLHCGAIHERPRRNLQEHLQKIWCGGLLQGRKHHQRSPSTP